jgi:soluble lytic murein transglycosylase-like protein
MMYAHLSAEYILPDPCGLIAVVCDYELSVEDKIVNMARKYGVPAEIALYIGKCESNYRTDATNPLSSARGVFQFLRDTANETGRRMGNGWTHDDMFDADKNIEMAMYLMSKGEYWRWSCYKALSTP